MIERATRRFGRLVFDRDAIVRAALRAYIEAIVGWLPNCLSFTVCDRAGWIGDFQRGAIYKDGGGGSAGSYDVVAWTEAGVVGLAYELGWGPIEQLGLSIDAVTCGPDDVRGALPGLPDELEPALVLATSMLGVGYEHSARDAGVGFWLCGDRGGGTLFDDRDACGADRLAMWGLLRGGRLRRMCDRDKTTAAQTAEFDRTIYAPFHMVIDAMTDRALHGPTELTTEELAIIMPRPPDREKLLSAQRMLQEVGITWPGSPDIAPETPRPRYNPFTNHPYVCPKHFEHLVECFGPVLFNRDAIVRAALRAYVETTLAPLDPLARHTLMPCVVPKWTGNLERGAFFNGDGCGDDDVIAWTEAGVLGLAYKRGNPPIDSLAAALPGLPDDLLPAFEMAAGLLEVGAHGEKLASVGFWLFGDHAAGTLFDDPTLPRALRLVAWGKLKNGRLPLLGDRQIAALAAMLARTTASPIHAILDAVVDRRLRRPTKLLLKELATLFPTPLDPEEQFFAAWKLQKVGITWPGIPKIPSEPRGVGRSPFLASPKAITRCHPLGYLVFDQDAIVRAALRAYIEVTLAFLDPLQRHPFKAARYSPTWTGDLERGAFSHGTHGEYDVVAWTEAGVVGLARGPGPAEWLPENTVTSNLDDGRAALPGLPDELLPTFEMAFGLFDQGHSPREKITPVGFWLSGNRVAGTLFDTPAALGVWRLANWGRIGRGRVLPAYDPKYATTITEETFRTVAPFLATVDAITARALLGPTELMPDELATLLPTPPDPKRLLAAQRMLQQVGITWPGSPNLPEPPQ